MDKRVLFIAVLLASLELSLVTSLPAGDAKDFVKVCLVLLTLFARACISQLTLNNLGN